MTQDLHHDIIVANAGIFVVFNSANAEIMCDKGINDLIYKLKG
jgi:hypothetical protein